MKSFEWVMCEAENEDVTQPGIVTIAGTVLAFEPSRLQIFGRISFMEWQIQTGISSAEIESSPFLRLDRSLSECVKADPKAVAYFCILYSPFSLLSSPSFSPDKAYYFLCLHAFILILKLVCIHIWLLVPHLFVPPKHRAFPRCFIL